MENNDAVILQLLNYVETDRIDAAKTTAGINSRSDSCRHWHGTWLCITQRHVEM